MAVDRFRLSFVNGESREVSRIPAHQVRAEAIAGPPGTMTYLYASLWAADTGGHGSRKDFDAWIEGFEDFDPIPAEGDARPPATGPGGSPD
jgi:hypothetical protein